MSHLSLFFIHFLNIVQNSTFSTFLDEHTFNICVVQVEQHPCDDQCDKSPLSSSAFSDSKSKHFSFINHSSYFQVLYLLLVESGCVSHWTSLFANYFRRIVASGSVDSSAALWIHFPKKVRLCRPEFQFGSYFCFGIAQHAQVLKNSISLPDAFLISSFELSILNPSLLNSAIIFFNKFNYCRFGNEDESLLISRCSLETSFQHFCVLHMSCGEEKGMDGKLLWWCSVFHTLDLEYFCGKCSLFMTHSFIPWHFMFLPHIFVLVARFVSYR